MIDDVIAGKDLHSTMLLLILRPNRIQTWSCADLHSTMLLLIPWHPCRGRYSVTIYIPLCFYLYTNVLTQTSDGYVHLHSTMLLLILLSPILIAVMHIIYIPLCFYLYADSFFCCVPANVFTFHYASTYTADEFLKNEMNWYLHSTMLLLIPDSADYKRRGC